MRVVLAEILPLALVVTLSPLNIIAAIVLLLSKRPFANAASYLAGFVVGVAAVVGALTALAAAIGHSTGAETATWRSILKIALGAWLLYAAQKKVRARPGPDDDGELPGWMAGLTGYGPGRSARTGFLVGAFNPKNAVVAAAAGATVATAGLSVAEQVGVLAIYVVVAVAGVAAPLVVMALLGDRAPAVLGTWRDWLGHNSATVMAVLFFVFGVVLIAQGIGSI